MAKVELRAERAAAFHMLIETAKLNRLDPAAYLRDVLTRIADHPGRRLADLLPWNWTAALPAANAADRAASHRALTEHRALAR